MPIAINGSGTITGISVGGIPDGTVDTDVLAANAVTFAKIGTTEQGQLCKAWVNFDGTGTVAIRASYNVSSITDNSTGNYTVNFANALADANFVATGCCRPTAGGTPHYVFAVENKDTVVRSTSAICFYFLNPITQLAADVEVADVAIFR
jgi:hypothetical protein